MSGEGAAALGNRRTEPSRGHRPGGFATSVLQGLAWGKMAHTALGRGRTGLLGAGWDV